MSGLYGNKRKRQLLTSTSSDIEPGALILSGDAAHVDYEDKVPIWKQEVVDERGRKRLHGAFSGGFSAGYFNTVGSAEGWTPSTFVSSRTSRHKASDKRAVDYMDEEDLADIVGDRELKLRLETEAASFAENEMKMDLSKPRAKSVERPDPEALAKPSTIVQVLVKHQNRRASAKPISQFEDEDEHDIDAFDIDPKVKYDQTLIKKSKKKSAASHHVFQTKKVLKNPAPEPETVQRPTVPERIASESQNLDQLPSIGDWTLHTKNQSAGHNSFLDNADKTTNLSQSAHSMKAEIVDTLAATPIPPWRQVSQDSEAKIPPWRQDPGPRSSVASIGQATALLALQSTFTPYTNNITKHERYQEYLRIEAGVQPGEHEQKDLEPDTWKAECEEFRKCALMYKPMTGAMSRKFTSSIQRDKADLDIEEDSSGSGLLTGSLEAERLGAARAGKFGHMTRSVEEWNPSKLLCKRYNVLHPGVDY